MAEPKRPRDGPKERVYGGPPPHLALRQGLMIRGSVDEIQESKPVVQHNPDTKPLNPVVIVNQALPIPVVILEKALQRIPHRKTVPELHRRPVIRPKIIQQLQRKRTVLRQLIHRMITGMPQIPLDIRIVIIPATLRQSQPGLHHKQPTIITVAHRTHDPVPASRTGVSLPVGLMIETNRHSTQCARPHIPVQLMPEEQFRLIIGLAEWRRFILVIDLPEGSLGITKPESGFLVENARQ